MDIPTRTTVVHYAEHGSGVPVLVLHGGGVDHREPQACFEPAFDGVPGYRRIYPDLPGMGRTAAGPEIGGAEDVLEVLLDFADRASGGTPYLLAGHSAGACYARAMALAAPQRVAGLALVCPLLPGDAEVPEHRVLVPGVQSEDRGFTQYFVIHTRGMLERYERFVAPGAQLADAQAMERIGRHWVLPAAAPSTYEPPTLLVAGRQDSTVGFAGTMRVAADFPNSTLAVLDGAGHALPHEQPLLLRALLVDWLARTRRGAG